MRWIYQMLGISRQGHHQQRRRRATADGQRGGLLEEIARLRADHPLMGARKMYYCLRPTTVGINRFERLVIEAGFGLQRPRSPLRTTVGSRLGVSAENLTHGLVVSAINQLWVSDISYVLTSWGVYYLVHMLDVYSRRLLGLRLSPTMRAEENIAVLNESFGCRRQSQFDGLIHHSDAGSQYTSREYRRLLEKATIRQSIAQSCLENGYSERLNGVLKQEYLQPFLSLYCQASGPDARTSLGSDLQRYLRDVLRLYNCQRPHQELAYRTPVEFETWTASLPESERPRLTLHDFHNPPPIPPVDSGHF